jgi:anaerobic magnesium-protoporphyrin IX monomethyl ester cyclase
VYHSRTPENVVDEMMWLRQVAHPDHIWFADDIFGLKPGWIAHFDEIVNSRGAKTPFKCLSRVDLLLKENNVRHLKNAGCQTVWVGAESAAQHVLDAMEKGTTVEQIYEATELLHRNGIRVGFFLQYGYPGETRKDIERTLQMVKDCMPDEIGISVSYPLPGTRFFERVKQDLQGKQNWVDSGDLDMMFQGTFSPDFYRVLHRLTHKKFRVWQAKDLVKNVLLHPWRTNRSSIRRIAASVYHAASLPRLEAHLNTLATEHDSARHD